MSRPAPKQTARPAAAAKARQCPRDDTSADLFGDGHGALFAQRRGFEADAYRQSKPLGKSNIAMIYTVGPKPSRGPSLIAQYTKIIVETLLCK